MKRFLAAVLALFLISVSAVAELAAQQLLSAGRVDLAIADLQTHLRTTPNDAKSYHLLSRAYYSLQRWDDAIRASEKAVALDPNNSDYHMWLGRAYGEKAEHSSWFTAIGLAKKVRAQFERAVQLDNGNLDAQSNLAEFYLDAPGFLGGGKDKARAQAQRLAAMDPPTAHWVNAQIAEKESNWAVAEHEYRLAIQRSGNQASYWLNLASFYRHRGRLDDMQEAINSATRAQISKGDVWVDAAELLFHSGRDFPAAIQYLRHYLSSNATVADAPPFQAHYLLGLIFEKQGNKQAAADEYRAALSLARDFSVAQQGLNRVAQ
jgi:tetratricopeptide (TPR) repeat protein